MAQTAQQTDRRKAAEEKAALAQAARKTSEDLRRRNLAGRAIFWNFVRGMGRALYRPASDAPPRLITYEEYNALNRPDLKPHSLQ